MQLEQIGPYRIVGRLGKGGMGTVFEGIHLDSGEPAAVKLLAPNLAQVEGFRERFEAEIEVLKKLNHPNIVRLLGFGEQDRQLFYAMELIPGSSLEAELSKGRRFDWREVVRIALDVLKALRHAHNRGIIHRDIKPGNLLLSPDGNVKMADFGIARFFGNSKLTITGSIIGTAEYMAPEQAAGKHVDPRSDLYSLGAVMFVLLARRPVFKGKSLREILHKQQYEIPEPVCHFNADVPEEMERIIAQLLEKDPERRVPNAMVLSRLLESMQQSMTLPGETVEVDSEEFLSLSKSEIAGDGQPPQDADAEGPKTAGYAATSDFSATPEKPATAYVEPSSDPLAQTIAATPLPILPVESEEKEAVSPASRFIPVRQEDLDHHEKEETQPALISLGTWLLIGALLTIGGSMWYLLQPPTADGLYDHIMSHLSDESISSILAAEDDIHNFLDRFSGDPRAGKIRGYEREIELDQLERKLPRAENLSPLEQAYLEALGHAQSDPEKCAAHLQAAIDLYASPSDPPGSPMGNCILLARRHLKQIKQEIEARAAEQLPQLQARLDRAESLAATDPDRAKKMYRAVIELYSPKSWAAPAVNKAREALEAIEKK